MGTLEDLGRPRCVLEARARLAESPLWSSAERALYWVDIAAREIHRFDPVSGEDRRWPVPSEPGCIALAASGGLVAALRDGFYGFDPARASLERLSAAPYDPRVQRFNDGRCDPAGRFLAGAMHEPRDAPRAAMFCLERGAVREAWGPSVGWGVTVSNGLAFSPDGRTVYQSDTSAHVIWRFDYDPASGRASNRRVFARVPDDRSAPGYGGRPDGAAVDAEGCYWSAQYDGARVLRFAPGGEPCGVLQVPARRVTMVAFGGPDLRTLFITTAREGASEAELAAYPLSGCLFACEVDVAGRPEPAYRE